MTFRLSPAELGEEDFARVSLHRQRCGHAHIRLRRRPTWNIERLGADDVHLVRVLAGVRFIYARLERVRVRQPDLLALLPRDRRRRPLPLVLSAVMRGARSKVMMKAGERAAERRVIRKGGEAGSNGSPKRADGQGQCGRVEVLLAAAGLSESVYRRPHPSVLINRHRLPVPSSFGTGRDSKFLSLLCRVL